MRKRSEQEREKWAFAEPSQAAQQSSLQRNARGQ
jgi:hypothetical protein